MAAKSRGVSRGRGVNVGDADRATTTIGMNRGQTALCSHLFGFSSAIHALPSGRSGAVNQSYYLSRFPAARPHSMRFIQPIYLTSIKIQE